MSGRDACASSHSCRLSDDQLKGLLHKMEAPPGHIKILQAKIAQERVALVAATLHHNPSEPELLSQDSVGSLAKIREQ